MSYFGQPQPSQPMGYSPYTGQPSQPPFYRSQPVYQSAPVHFQQPALPDYVQQLPPDFVSQKPPVVPTKLPQPSYAELMLDFMANLAIIEDDSKKHYHQSPVFMMQQPPNPHLRQPLVIHRTSYVSKPIRSPEEQDVDDVVCCLGFTALFTGLILLGSDHKKP